MADDDQLRQELLARIEARRAGIRAFLRSERPRTRRLATATIVLSSLAALFTAGPAIGGETFSGGVQKTLGLTGDSIVWRTLCLCALLVSAAAALLTGIGRSQDAVARLSAVEAVETELDGLSTMIRFGRLPLEDAVRLYHDYTVKIPFVEDQFQPAFFPVAAPAAPFPAQPPPPDRGSRVRPLPPVPRSSSHPPPAPGGTGTSGQRPPGGGPR
jgi:hypothetical protein